MHRNVYPCQREKSKLYIEQTDKLLNECKRKENMKIKHWRSMIKLTKLNRTSYNNRVGSYGDIDPKFYI